MVGLSKVIVELWNYNYSMEFPQWWTKFEADYNGVFRDQNHINELLKDFGAKTYITAQPKPPFNTIRVLEFKSKDCYTEFMLRWL